MRAGVRTGLSVNRSLTAYVYAVEHARAVGADLLAVNHAFLRSPVAGRALPAKLAVRLTVDADGLLTRVVADSRVTCMITDRPLRARALNGTS